MPRTKSPSKPWPLIIRPDVHQLATAAATERGINPSYLLETILIRWLNANILRQPIAGTEFPRGSKLAYRVGQLAAVEMDLYGELSFDTYVFQTNNALSQLRKQLKRGGYLPRFLTWYSDIGNYSAYHWTPSYYPWFLLGLYSLPSAYLGADPPEPAQLPPDGEARLTTDPPGTETIKRRGTAPWFLAVGDDVKTAVKFAASQLTYTVTGLVETVLIDWLNRNHLADRATERAGVPTDARQAYVVGQLARLELDQFGEVSLDGYLRDAGASLGSLKPRLRKAKQLTPATDALFREVWRKIVRVPPARRFWFFAGFCNLSFDFLAAKHERREIPGN